MLSCCSIKKVKQLGQETYTKIALSEKNLSLSSYKDIYFFPNEI